MRYLLAILLLFACASEVWGEINVDRIAQIESSGNPNAYNKKSKAVGLCQITPIVLKEYNQLNKNLQKRDVSHDDLFYSEVNYMIADWYLNRRIPQMIISYGIPLYTWQETQINVKEKWLGNDLILIAYDWGIGNLVKWYKKGHKYSDLPKETRNYLKRYYREEIK